jgi:uncharacterized protein (DUF362 family)
MSSVAVTKVENINLPLPEDLSPCEMYPEYPFANYTLSKRNDVYSMVRRCLFEYGCDGENFGSHGWNPLGGWIKKGDRVFVLTNFVKHREAFESSDRFNAKCTHGSVIRAVIDYAVIATGRPDLVSFGNAPLQSCDYERVTLETGASSISRFYRDSVGVDIGPHDLRLLKSKWTAFGFMLDVKKEPLDDAVMFDLGTHSLLDEFYKDIRNEVQVRVGDYPVSETMSFHGKNKHIYTLNKRILEADVIISIPKLKTHEKVGVTCALKGTVGSIGKKECLAHHRRGASDIGGDEYPSSQPFRDLASYMAEKASEQGTDLRSNLYRMASRILSRAMRVGRTGIMFGAWHGNDTAWRMSLDIARILRYGRSDGTLSEMPVRSHLALVDGIIAGEGEGPIYPTPRRTGALIFGPDVCAVDAVCAYVMGFDPRKVKLIYNSFSCPSYPMTNERISDICILFNGESISINKLMDLFSPPFIPPKGWKRKIEAEKISFKTNIQ